MTDTLIFYLALLLIAAALEPLAQRLRIPFAAVLVVLGYTAKDVEDLCSMPLGYALNYVVLATC